MECVSKSTTDVSNAYKIEDAADASYALPELLDLSAILQRVGSCIGSSKDVDIAEALGAGRSSLSTWRKRNHIPFRNIVNFCFKRNISVETVLLGSGQPETQRYQRPEDALPTVLRVQSRMQLVFSAEQLKTTLDFAYQTQADDIQIEAFINAAFALAQRELPVQMLR